MRLDTPLCGILGLAYPGLENERKLLVFKGLEVEARSGVEPLYEVLQTSA